jgi:preprotein translocase subunit SecG
MLYNLLLVLLIIDGLLLAMVVMLQAGQGGGLASLGGGTTDMVLGGRQAVTILTKATWITGGAFVAIAFLLSIAATNRRAGESEVQRRLRGTPQTQAPQPAPLQVTPAPPPVKSPPDSGH